MVEWSVTGTHNGQRVTRYRRAWSGKSAWMSLVSEKLIDDDSYIALPTNSR